MAPTVENGSVIIRKYTYSSIEHVVPRIELSENCVCRRAAESPSALESAPRKEAATLGKSAGGLQ
jgi:hypothetical protein